MREIITNVPTGAVRKIHEKMSFVNDFLVARRKKSLGEQIVRGDFGYDIAGIVTHIERFSDIFTSTKVLDSYISSADNGEIQTAKKFEASFIKRIKDELREPVNFDYANDKLHFDIELNPENEVNVHQTINFIKLIHGYKFANSAISVIVTLRNSSYKPISISASRNPETGKIEFVSSVGYKANSEIILANTVESWRELAGYLRA